MSQTNEDRDPSELLRKLELHKLRGTISEAQYASKKKELVSRIRTGGQPPTKKQTIAMPEKPEPSFFEQWYAKKPVIIALLILFFPVGLILMWKFAAWTKKTKWIVTVGVMTLIFIAAYNAPPTISVQNAKGNKISTDDAEYMLTGSVSAMKLANLHINGQAVSLTKDSEFSYKVSLKEGDNTFDLASTNANGTVRQILIIHRTTQAEFSARTEAQKLASEEKAEKEKQKQDEEKAKRDAKANKEAEKKAKAAAITAKEKAEAEAKAAAEGRKPKHTFKEFYEWANVSPQCILQKDIDGDGDQDLYNDKSCLQDKYKEYIKPSGFDYGTTRDSTGEMCPAGGRYYYVFCSRFGDIIPIIGEAKQSFVLGEAYKKAEAIYNGIALTNGGN